MPTPAAARVMWPPTSDAPQETRVDFIRRMAEALVADAVSYGVVLTIHTEPREPLRMGAHDMVVETRAARVLAPLITGSWD